MYIFLHPNAPFYVMIRDNLPHVGVRIFCYYQRLKLSSAHDKVLYIVCLLFLLSSQPFDDHWKLFPSQWKVEISSSSWMAPLPHCRNCPALNYHHSGHFLKPDTEIVTVNYLLFIRSVNYGHWKLFNNEQILMELAALSLSTKLNLACTRTSCTSSSASS